MYFKIGKDSFLGLILVILNTSIDQMIFILCSLGMSEVNRTTCHAPVFPLCFNLLFQTVAMNNSVRFSFSGRKNKMCPLLYS